MNQKLKVICFIFARGGSKGVPGKNIKLLGGRPLIAYSINLAKKSSKISEIIISTDDPQIAAIGVSEGAEVPFFRPANLSSDDASEWEAWQHAIDWYQKNRGHFDFFISLPTTSPFRNLSDIESCLSLIINDSSADIVITVTESKRSPYFNMVKKENNNFVRIVIPRDKYIIRRQDVPETFDITTVAYVARPDFILNSKGIFDGNVRAVKIPAERAIDIDSLFDFEIAEALIKNKIESHNT